MRKLSLWGKNNPIKARLIIIFSHIILFNLALFTGIELTSLGISLPEYLKYLILFVSFLAFITYPSAKNKSAYTLVSYYTRQKICDFLFALSFFGMIVCLSVSDDNISTFFPDIRASTLSSIEKSKTKPKAAEILASLEHRDKITHSEKRILKKEFKKQIGIYIKTKITGDKEKSDQTVLMILAIIGALGLFLVVAALACGLGCNGSGTGAIAVAVLGTAAIVFGLVAVIRAIQRKGNKQPPKENVGT
jgi:hypothetical protein